MAKSETDRIEKTILLRAPRARVWRALTDPLEFGEWFGAKLPAGSFRPGARARGAVTSPGYEHLTMDITIDKMEPERLFSWRWHPGAVDAKRDYSKDPTTLVVFTLEDAHGGTRLKVVESGFDQVPDAYRATSFRQNDDGWTEQMKNVERHVGQGAWVPGSAGALARSAPIFAALGDGTRLRLVSRMSADGPLSIARLTAGAGVTRQAVTKHLKVLASAGLVRGSRQGRERLWELEPSRLEDARHALDVISQQWDRTLGRLKEFVEPG